MGNKLEVQTIVEQLKKENENATIEGELLKKKMIRQLYKLVGEPKQEDFPEEFKIAGGYWKKHSGYTGGISMIKENTMLIENAQPTDWRIERPSRRKIEIVEEYTRAGWWCRVGAYNVVCMKYVKHPRYDNLWVEFYSSRDCNKYELVIEMEEK